MTTLLDDAQVVQRIFDHIDAQTTDAGATTWREPVEHYRCPDRLAAEVTTVLRRTPTPFCPSAALREAGAYVARDAAGTPLVAVRGADGRVRAFRNACRHRGTQLIDGVGCAKAFVCRYHGWTYGLDGALRHVPHAQGFPGLDPETHGLVPVHTVERHGLVFVTQDGDRDPDACLDALDGLVTPAHAFLGVEERQVPVNWKIFAEGFLEGYHIRSTHRETFYPVQYDNLNVVETFGDNGRIAFPYRNVERLRPLPPARRSARGVLTYVYHLFPNVMVATFPHTVLLVVLEPTAVDATRLLTYALSDRGSDGRDAVKQSQDFVNAGAAEDRAMAIGVQRGLAAGANDCFEFGAFETLIGHFHRTLEAHLRGAAAPAAGAPPAARSA